MRNFIIVVITFIFYSTNSLAQFTDNFEDGNLDKWTVAGRQQGVNKAEVIFKDGSNKAHLRHEDFTEITLEKVFPYNPNMSFSFELETNVNSTASSTSAFYAAAGAKFEFYDISENRLGGIYYITLTSNYTITNNQGKQDVNINQIPEGQTQSFNLSASDLLSQITPSGTIEKVKLTFYGYASGWPYNMVGEVWVDDVIVSEEPYTGPTGELLAYYPFNGNANDESGNGYHASNNGASPSSDRFGNNTSAYSFDGVDDRVILPFSSNFLKNSFSVTGWYYMTKFTIGGQNQGIISNDRMVDRGLGITISDDLKTRMSNGTGESFSIYNESAAEINRWYFFAFIYDGQTISQYIDGELYKTIEASGSLAGDAEIEIGHDLYDAGTYRYFGGKIDDIRLYNIDLSESEIRALYQENGWEGELTPETDLLEDARDGKTYNTIKIGEQWWMAENLNYDATGSYFYNNNSSYGQEFGRLYTWAAAINSCPDGWHLPSDDEWKILETELGMSEADIDILDVNMTETTWRGDVQGKMMKEGGSSDLDLKLGGYYVPSSYYSINEYGRYWSSTEYAGGSEALNRRIWINSDGVSRRHNPKDRRFSVRCLKDASTSDGLLAYYPFNGNANDESGNGRNGTIDDASFVTDRFGNTNSSLSFDGINDFVNVPTMPINRNFSICGWIKPDNAENDTYLYYEPAGSNSSWDPNRGLYRPRVLASWNHTYRKFWFEIRTEAGNDNLDTDRVQIVTSDTYSEGKMYFFAVVRNNDVLKIFIDGVEVNTEVQYLEDNAVLSSDLHKAYDNNSGYIQKAYIDHPTRFGSGTVDDIRIFDISLTDTEIANLYTENSWTGNEDIILEIEPVSKLFAASKIYKNSKSFFYCNINAENDLSYLEDPRLIPISSSVGNIPTYIKYLGNGILQFEVDFESYPELEDFTFEFPAEVKDLSGATLKFINSPETENFSLLEPDVEQSVDFFGGGSLGGKLTGGSLGLGPSVAAAAVSVEGKAGMGLTMARELNGDQSWERRLEMKVGLKAKAPEVNAGVGEIDVGAKARMGVSGLVKQKMKFPNTLSDEIIMKAKAYSLLETFSLGGVELNPFTSLFINALKNSLMKFNPDLNEVYNQLYYSTTVGAGAYFEAGAEVSFSLMKDKCEFSLAEATLGTTFDLGLEIHHQDPHRHFNMNFAGEFSSGLLGFEFFNAIETGHVLSSSIGAKIFVEADYVKDSGFEDFGLGFEFSPTGSIVLDDYSSWNQLKFNIPMGVIQRNLQSENLIGFVSPFFYPSYDNQQLNLHPGKIVEYLDYYINDTPIELDDLDNYVTFSRYQSSKLGKSWDLSIDLTVALGIGAGVKLGIEYAFLDELKYPLTKYAIYKNKVLPIHKFEPLSDEDRLFTVTDEMYDLFHGAALLIKDPLQALQEKVDQAIEAGKEFALDVFNSTVKVAGVLSQPGKFVIRKISSALKRTKKSAFNGSEVINAYTSSNVVNLNGETNALMEGEETTLYIISDHYNISLLDESDNLIMEFDPVNLSIVTNPDIIAELNFTSEDLKNVKMYYYDDQNLTWMELEGDLNPALDTVETLVGKSGTYGIGINYSTNMDIAPVEIVDYYPANLSTIQPDDTLWVRLYENPIGSGIDFTRSAILIDGVEVETEWNPVKNLLMFIPEEPMSDGEHSFAVNIYDNNDNYSNVFSVFKIASTFIDYSLVMENRFSFNCYPNPVINTAMITINIPDDEEFARISIYNSKGEVLSVLHEGIFEKGLNEIQISRNAILGNEILPGVYFIKYENSQKSIVKKLIFK